MRSLSSLVLFLSVVSVPLMGQSAWETHHLRALSEGTTAGSIWTGKRGEVYVWTRGAQPGTDIPQSVLYKSTDAAATWSAVLTLPDSDAAGLWGAGESEVFASATRCPAGYAADCGAGRGVQIFRSGDGGASWAQQVLPAGELKGADVLRGESNDVYTAVCPWMVDCTYAGSQVLHFDGAGWTTSSAGATPTAKHPEALAYFAPGHILEPSCWSASTCNVGRSWGMRDAQGALHLFATGSGGSADGVKIWQFTETTPGSLAGSWGERNGFVFSDGNGDFCGSGAGIWGSSPSDIWVAGRFNPGGTCASSPEGEGRLYHFDGTSWNRVTTPSDPLPLFARGGIWGTASDDLWIAAESGDLYHFGLATKLVGALVSKTTTSADRSSIYSRVARAAATGATSAATATNSNSIWVAKVDGGTTAEAPVKAADILPFDLASTRSGFRTLSYPSIAADSSGRVYLVWAARQSANGEARVSLSVSPDGKSWPTPQVVDPPAPLYDESQSSPVLVHTGLGHQFMPSVSVAGSRVAVSYYSLYEDSTVGELDCPPGKTCNNVSQFFEYRKPAGVLLPFPPSPSSNQLAAVFGRDIVDPQTTRRHTLDVRVATAAPGASPSFTSTQLSRYAFGSTPSATASSKPIQQMGFNPPNLPLFVSGTTPFIGDYIDVSTQTMAANTDGSWAFNTFNTSTPFFHVTWTDNRDVRPPSDGNWTNYTPNLLKGYTAAALPASCVVGQTGMRNQNIYTARVTEGLAVLAPGNSKPLSPSLRRAFSVVVQNHTGQAQYYRLTLSPESQAVQASFAPDAQSTSLVIAVEPGSSQSLTVFATSANARGRLLVNATQLVAQGSTLVPSGKQSSVLLNPDLTNPDLTNPDLTNRDIKSVEIFTPDLTNRALTNPDLTNPDLTNPDLTNPDLTNPDLTNPDLTNPDLTNRSVRNPDLTNPDLTNPDLTNPDLTNADLRNASLTDVTWKLTNTGNTRASYTVRLATPQGPASVPSTFKTQLILTKSYATPAESTTSCAVVELNHNILIANIPNPIFYSPQAPDLTNPDLTNPDLTNPDLTNPDLTNRSLKNATISVAPGETARISLRIQAPTKQQAVDFATNMVQPVVTAQAPNTNTGQRATTLVIAPVDLTRLALNAPYSLTLRSLGGTGNPTWSIPVGALPAGLSFDPARGAISGTPTVVGTFSFTVQAVDQGNPPQTATRQFMMVVASAAVAPPVLTSGSLANGATYLSGGLVPGSFAQIKGTGLAGTTRIWADADFAGLGNKLPTSLDGVQVLVNGTPSAVYYISPTQVNFQVPNVTGNADVQLLYNGAASNILTAPVSSSAPGLFPTLGNGVNYPAALFTTDNLNVGDPAKVDPAASAVYRKAKAGDTIELFATGLLASNAGELPIAQPLNGATVTVTLGNVTVPALYAGQTPYVGEFQINFTVPPQFATLPEGDYPISITINGASSPTTIGSIPPGPLVIPVAH